MQVKNDKRRLRLYRVKTAQGDVLVEAGADVWQDVDGHLQTSGLWAGLLPFSSEDIEIQAQRQGISPLEWMRIRMLNCSLVSVEVVD
jgi:hypothetical protein